MTKYYKKMWTTTYNEMYLCIILYVRWRIFESHFTSSDYFIITQDPSYYNVTVKKQFRNSSYNRQDRDWINIFSWGLFSIRIIINFQRENENCQEKKNLIVPVEKNSIMRFQKGKLSFVWKHLCLRSASGKEREGVSKKNTALGKGSTGV